MENSRFKDLFVFLFAGINSQRDLKLKELHADGIFIKTVTRS